MNFKATESKENIRKRMLQHAMHFWKINDTGSLDPVVKLMLEALSVELYNVSNELQATRVRVLERIATLLAPETLIAPRPAHAILMAQPTEPVEIIEASTVYVTPYKNNVKKGSTAETDVFFTPADHVKTVNARIKYLQKGDELIEYDQHAKKTIIGFSPCQTITQEKTAWLGIDVGSNLPSPLSLPFYFNYNEGAPEFAMSLKLLQLAKWTVNNKELRAETGLKYHEPPKDEPRSGPDTGQDLLLLVVTDIKNYYHERFITLHFNIAPGNNTSTCPREVSGRFNGSKVTSELLWIKLEFSPGTPPVFIQHTDVYLNAFPVLNRNPGNVYFRLKGSSNIVPLRIPGAEQLLAIESVEDGENRYEALAYDNHTDTDNGTYNLRYAGIERFDQRNAHDLINYLMEVIRSESAAFSAYGYDFIATTLKELDQRMVSIEQKTAGFRQQDSESPAYIMVKPKPGKDTIYTAYFTTIGSAANGITAGTRLQQPNGIKTGNGSLVLITPVKGGKDRLKPDEQLQAFRFGFATRNRIVTADDIRSFCTYELGNQLSKVTVERGVELSAHPKEGFVNVIKVLLTPAPGGTPTGEEWGHICNRLTIKLQSLSGVSNNYRVLLAGAGNKVTI